MIKTMNEQEFIARKAYADSKQLIDQQIQVIPPDFDRVREMVSDIPVDAVYATDLTTSIIEKKYDLLIEPRTQSTGEYGFVNNIAIIFNGNVYPSGSEVVFTADYRIRKDSYKLMAINWLTHFFDEKYSD